MLDVTDAAPDFTLPRDGGTFVSLADLQGRPFILFFYPRDDTPGCTKESIGFSELLGDLNAAGVQIYGVSKDSVASHDKFVSKHNLTTPLLSDENGTLCEDYGVWKEKNMYGKKFMGIERSTFLIDSNGKIARVWRKVKVPGHVAEVIEAARAL